MTLDEIIESNMKIQELTGKIRANENIIAFAKTQISMCENQIADILKNTSPKERHHNTDDEYKPCEGCIHDIDCWDDCEGQCEVGEG